MRAEQMVERQYSLLMLVLTRLVGPQMSLAYAAVLTSWRVGE